MCVWDYNTKINLFIEQSAVIYCIQEKRLFVPLGDDTTVSGNDA